jgi:Protein of unknown function (DUF3014)
VTEPLDLDLTSGSPAPLIPPPPPRRRHDWLWIVGIIVGLAVGAYFLFGRQGRRPTTTPAPTPSTAAPRSAVPPATNLGQQGVPVDVPPLDESDAVVRSLVAALSKDETIAAWLATDNLIRHFTAVVQAVAEDRNPRQHVQAIKPTANFGAASRGGRLVIDPASYRRYNRIASAVASLDPDGCARLYSTLKPRIGEAYRELGFPDAPFDGALEDALITLVRTPIPDDPIEVVADRGVYVFADRRLEALAPAQKQLIRMGPENARIVKERLRAIAIALGVPVDRLD